MTNNISIGDFFRVEMDDFISYNNTVYYYCVISNIDYNIVEFTLLKEFDELSPGHKWTVRTENILDNPIFSKIGNIKNYNINDLQDIINVIDI